MQRAPLGNFELPLDDISDPQFSLQPMAAAEPDTSTATAPQIGRLQKGHPQTGRLVCLFPGCELKFPDAFALNHHQQQDHDGSPILGETITLPLYEVSPPRVVAANNRDPSFDLSPFANGAGPSADPAACYTALNAQGMTVPQRDYFGHATSTDEGLRLAYPDQSGFAFAGANHTLQPNTNPQVHLTQQFQMGITAPPGPSVQYTTNQVQAPTQQNSHGINPSNVPSRRYRCQHPGCNKTVTRHSDLNRHMKTHQAGVKEFDCPDAGCNRKGINGFPRKDKMMDHYNAVHQ